MTTDLTKRDGAALTVPNGGGLEGAYDEGDVALPICAIVQPTSTDRGEEGTFWLSTGQNLKEMDTVVLNVNFTRTLWNPPGSDVAIVCRSPDRRMGTTSYPSIVLGEAEAKKQKTVDGEPMFIECASCPHFNDDQFGSAEKLCSKGFALLMVELESQNAFLYFPSRSAKKAVIRSIVTPLIQRDRAGQDVSPRNAYHWSVTPASNKKGKFYVPTITPLPPFEPTDAERYAAQAASMSGRATQQMEDEDLVVAEQPELGT